MSELMNNEYGHCGECHEVHFTSNMVEIDGYLYCRDCAAADNAALRAELAASKEREAKLLAHLKNCNCISHQNYHAARRALESSNE